MENEGSLLKKESCSELEKKFEGKLYHSTSLAELFLVWRDDEMPMTVAWPYCSDSDAEPDSVQTYWFKKPIDVAGGGCLGRGIFLEITRNEIEEENISEGEMRFQEFSEDYDGNTTKRNRRLDEVYVKERIPLDKIKIYVTKEQKEEIVGQKQRLQSYIKDVKKGWQPSLTEDNDLISKLKDYEFGRDNFPDQYRTMKQDSYSGWVQLKKYSLNSVETEPQYRGRVLEVNPDFFLKLAAKILDFYDWALTLPNASEKSKHKEMDLPYEVVSDPEVSKPYSSESVTKVNQLYEKALKKATEFIEELEQQGMSHETPFGKILVIKDITFFNAGSNLWQRTSKFIENYSGYLYIGSGKGFRLNCKGELDENKIKNYLGDEFQGKIHVTRNNRHNSAGWYSDWWYDAFEEKHDAVDVVLRLDEKNIIDALKNC